METNIILEGDCIESMKKLPDAFINTCVTSPPYYGLRDYGEDGQIGQEETPQQYIDKMVEVFAEVRRILRDDGTLWLNLGDSYAGSGKGAYADGVSRLGEKSKVQASSKGTTTGTFRKTNVQGLKPKNLMGIPWRTAMALQEDGWYLRQDIIWCLSGGTTVYTKTQKGVGIMTVREMMRLDPKTVKLWNGEKWTQLLGMNKSKRRGDEIEIVLGSGERISCTKTHKFPTNRGLLTAGELKVGDQFIRMNLPDNEEPRDCSIDRDAAWFAGLYIAEGSMSGDTIQISGHMKEDGRWQRLQSIARKFGGHITRTIDGNSMEVRMYGKVLVALLNELVSGKVAKNKCFSPSVWKYSNEFIDSMLDGYLSGDGHYDGKRWRLGFTRNYNLERDLRAACARLGYHIVLNPSFTIFNGVKRATFRGEIRKNRSGHHNEKNTSEIVEIRKARCREVYDLGVEDEPHLFALSSGILTHNSKPNPMPESVTDRCTKGHEYIFLMTKNPDYYFDYQAIRERSVSKMDREHLSPIGGKKNALKPGSYSGNAPENDGFRNKRSVWNVPIRAKSYEGAHFAVYPEDLITPCVLAGAPEGGIVFDPFFGAGTTGAVAIKNGRTYIGCELNPEYIQVAKNRLDPIHLKRENMEKADGIIQSYFQF
jgi:DNA modification methylase